MNNNKRWIYGVAVAQEEKQSSTIWKICGFIPGSPRPYGEVSLSKILNPTLYPLDPSVYESVRQK